MAASDGAEMYRWIALGMRRALQWLGVVVVLLGAHEAAASTELLKTQSGSLVHWARAEISVGLAPASSSRTVPHVGVVLAIQRATETWNAVHAGQPRLKFSAEPGAEVTIKFCRGKWHGDTIDLGKSQFTASLREGLVTAATVDINECDHTFTAPDENAANQFDMRAVMTHELGHVLGLGHSDNPAAIMHPSGRGAEVRKPHTDDKTALALIYFGRAYGRAPADAERESAAGSAQMLTDARTGTPRPSGRNLPVQAAAPNPGSPARADNTTPADPVSVLSLTARRGRQVLVYTCEPTLLPPMGAAPIQDVKRPTGRRARDGVR
jgi:predicted Zn-dependent protease